MFKVILTITVSILLLGQSVIRAEETQLDSVQSVLDKILSKEGISISGKFRSQYLNGVIGGNAISETDITHESTEHTSVDFDLRARPNTATQGRLVFRMHQDWQNFFSDISNPIFTRWISIDGGIKKMLFYNAGDFRQKYSPLTLYAPELGFIYEPDVFTLERREAMDEQFLGDNNRVLQGVNMNFNAEVEGIFNEFRLNVMGSRLRNVQTDLQDGNRAVAIIQTSTVEKYVYGGNLDLRFLDGVKAGATFMQIFDKKSTFDGPGNIDPDSVLQNTNIISIRAGADAHRFLDNPAWKARLSVEYAMSSDGDDAVGANASGDTVVMENTVSAAAMDISLDGEYAMEKTFNVKARLSYIQNDRDFRNEMAQSPTFIPRRIMNVEAGGANQSFFGDDPLYASSDALRHHVFKFTPSGATNRWHKAPFQKIAYTKTIYTRDEMANIVLDTALQLVMPFGPATPNRQGPRLNLSAEALDNAIEAQVLFASYQEPEMVALQVGDSSINLDKKEFSQLGAGIKVHVDKFLGWELPLNLSGSFQRSTMTSPQKNMGLGAGAVTISPKMDITSDIIMAGLTYNFWKNASLLAGLQMINTSSDYAGLVQDTATTAMVQTAGTADRNQMTWTVGLEYRLSEGAYLLGSLGKIDVAHENTAAAVDAEQMDFDQMFTNLALRVMF